MSHFCDLQSCSDPRCPARAAECHVAAVAPRQSPLFAPGAIEGPYHRPGWLTAAQADAAGKAALIFVAISAAAATLGFCVGYFDLGRFL